MTFGEAVHVWMEWRRFTIQQLSTASGVNYHKIYRLVNGTHTSITVGDAVKLARALGTTVEALVEGRHPSELESDELAPASQAMASPSVAVSV